MRLRSSTAEAPTITRMADEGTPNWDPFEPDVEHDPTPMPTPTSEGGASALSHPATPWVIVGVVVLIVTGILLMGRSDGESGDRARPTGDDGGAVVDGGNGDPAPAKDPCPGYEKGTNLFGVPAIAEEPGVHIWHDMAGFHLRLVPIDGTLESIQGTVVGDGVPLTLVEPAPPGSTEEDGLISFDLDAENPELLFKRSCETTAVTFDLTSDGAPIEPDRVSVGNDARPDAVPVVLRQLEG